MLRYLFIACVLVTTSFCGNVLQASSSYNDFSHNPWLKKSERKKVAPYLLPESHPAKPALDAIFMTTRASHNNETLIDAGFKILYLQPRSRIRVVMHDLLPGYLLKLVPDQVRHQKHGIADWQWLYRRCQQAKIVATVIKQANFKHFVVAKKWLYPLPLAPAPLVDKAHPLVLVATYMDLVSEEENYYLWKTAITPNHLKELMLIMRSTKGITFRPDNLPFLKDGRIAIIDTEANFRPTNFQCIREYLSEEMQAYWDALCKKRARR